MSPARLVVVALTAIACHGALAQSAVPPALAVQRLAPQLVTFAGSDANFQSLVNGLAQGSAVQISSTLPNGFTQTVTFTPAAPMTPAQIAQVLEGARQQLIGLGIAAPTAEQIGFTLMGGVVPTALGGTAVAGALRPNPPSVAAQMQQGNGAGGATTSATPTAPSTPVATTPAVTNAVNVQLAPTPVTTPSAGAPVAQRQTSDSLTAPGATSRSPAANISTTPPAAAAPTPPGAGSSRPATERPAQGPSRLGH